MKMAWFANPYDAAYNAMGTKILSEFDPAINTLAVPGASYDAWKAGLAAKFDPLDSVSFWGGTNTAPRAMFVKNGIYLLGFFDGARYGPQINLVKAEWDDAEPFAHPWGVSKTTLAALREVVPYNGAGLLDGIKYVRLFGYSWGGCLAGTANVLFREWAPGIQVRSNTYGSPKCGNYVFYNRLVGFGHSWYQLSGDLVPALPPDPEASPALVVFWYGLGGVYQRLSRWHHPPSGKFLNSDGSATDLDKPAVVPSLLAKAISDYWYDQANEAAAYHRIASYSNAFEAAAAAQQPPPPDPPPPPPPVRSRLTMGELRIVQQQGQAAIRADLNSPASVIRNYVTTPILPGTADRYHAVKLGGLWYVVRGENVVTLGPAKRTARSTARALNRALKR